LTLMVWQMITRVLSISTVLITVFAVVLATFSAMSLGLTLSSVSLRSFKLQEYEGGVSLVAELELVNRGFLPVSVKVVNVTLTDSSGRLLGGGGGEVVRVSPNSMSLLSVPVNIDVTHLSREMMENMLYNDQEIPIHVILQSSVEPLMTLTADAVAKVVWGAPLHGFRFGEPLLTPYNETHLTFSLPVSFTNNNRYVALRGGLKIRFYDMAAGNQVGYGSLSLDTAPGSIFTGGFEGFLSLPASAEEILLRGVNLDYRVVVEGEVKPLPFLRVEKTFSTRLGPFIKGLEVGKASMKPLNETYVEVAIPIALKGGPTSTTLNCKVYAELLDHAAVRSNTFSFKLGPAEDVELEVKFLLNRALNMGRVTRAVIILETDFGKLYREVDLIV